VYNHNKSKIYDCTQPAKLSKKICSWTTTTTPQLFYGPFSRTTRVSRCQKRNFWTLWCNGRLTEADTLTIRLGATPSGLTSAHLHHPPIFYMFMNSTLNLKFHTECIRSKCLVRVQLRSRYRRGTQCYCYWVRVFKLHSDRSTACYVCHTM